MRMLTLVAALVLVDANVLGAQDKKTSITFSKTDAGNVPAGWEVTQTNKGAGSVWKVVADASAPSKTGYALAQLASAPSKVFNLCVLKDTSFLDVEVHVDFKAIKGETDQGGGAVWRYVDANNYYIARLNPLEENFRLYKIVNGNRIQLASKDGVKVPDGKWHRLTIKHVGDHIECHLDGKKLLEQRDDTFKKAGRIGFWTKADAQTHFAGISAMELKRKGN
jgi:hypothetical protein